MPEYLNELLADKATMLVEENFTGVRPHWWWERRMGGGIAICQELDPEAMSRTIESKTGRSATAVRKSVRAELGLEDLEPAVLTFEIPGETSAAEAARMLRDRSSTPEGLAAGLYRQVEEEVRGEP
ncbi:MAG: hypothetical protein M3157_06010 [Actinomycetota bacterium]|nr:hypothetical protein [Actinomycetota bacterium]